MAGQPSAVPLVLVVSDLREPRCEPLVLYDRSLTHVRILVVEDPRGEQGALAADFDGVSLINIQNPLYAALLNSRE
jgi:hypothetical protein